MVNFHSWGSSAGFIQGLTGFAFALIAMSFRVWILPPQIATPLVVSASVYSHFTSLSYRKNFHKPRSQTHLALLNSGLNWRLRNLFTRYY